MLVKNIKNIRIEFDTTKLAHGIHGFRDSQDFIVGTLRCNGIKEISDGADSCQEMDLILAFKLLWIASPINIFMMFMNIMKILMGLAIHKSLKARIRSISWHESAPSLISLMPLQRSVPTMKS